MTKKYNPTWKHMENVKENLNGIEKAIIAAKGQGKLAKQLGVSQQYIGHARTKGYVSPQRAKEIECLYGVNKVELINPKIARALDLI
jgi:predicted transcriptional regulator